MYQIMLIVIGTQGRRSGEEVKRKLSLAINKDWCNIITKKGLLSMYNQNVLGCQSDII